MQQPDEPILLSFSQTAKPRHQPPVVHGTSVPQTGDAEGPGHRIPNPVSRSGQGCPPGEGAPAGPADLRLLFAGVAAAHDDGWRPIPPDQRQHVRETYTLQAFYDRYLADRRSEQVAKGELARGTREKELQALRRWSEWDRRQQPDEWPADQQWAGLPLAWLTGAYVQRWLHELRQELAVATVRSTWYQLRTVLNAAVRLKAIDQAPRPNAVVFEESDDDEDLFCRTWSPAELDAIFRGLAETPDLQVAFVLACNVGARPVDLFCLRWEQVRLDTDRPVIRFRARKTGKLHGIPLAGLTVAHLKRLRRSQLFEQGLLFPGRSAASASDPERSKSARRRNAIIKAAISAAGVDPVPNKPWQICRATCNTRLENHRPGCGRFVLGHANGVNAVSYHDPSELVFEAIDSLPQPLVWVAAVERHGDSLPDQRLLF